MTHESMTHRIGRLALVLAVAFVVSLAPRVQAPAEARLFTVVSGKGVICEIDPATGMDIFSFSTAGVGYNPGLAFNGSELFYTDETLGVVKVYLPDGTFVRDIAKPGVGPEAGAGLGVSATALYGVGTNTDAVTAVSPTDGTFLGSFPLTGAAHALTFAGSRGSLFVRVGASNAIAEMGLDGTLLNTIAGPTNFRGLAFSSSENVLYAVVTGTLYALDPDTGAVLPDYPVQIQDLYGGTAYKSGAAAADEIAPVCGDGLTNGEGEECDDGNLADGDGCDATCHDEYCGDGIVQARLGEECEQPGTPGCDGQCQKEEICFNLIDDDENGLADCEDTACPTCQPIGEDPARIRFAPPGKGGDYFTVHGSFRPATDIDPTVEPVGALLTNVHGEIFNVYLPAGSMWKRRGNAAQFRDKAARLARQGLISLDIRYRPRSGDYTFTMKHYGDFSAATEALMTLQIRVGNDVFVNSSPWDRTSRGWYLGLPNT